MTTRRERDKNLVDKDVRFCRNQVNELLSTIKPRNQKYILKTTTTTTAATTAATPPTTRTSRSKIN